MLFGVSFLFSLSFVLSPLSSSLAFLGAPLFSFCQSALFSIFIPSDPRCHWLFLVFSFLFFFLVAVAVVVVGGFSIWCL